MTANASAQALPGLRFDSVNLEVCRPLGRGAFGEVFLVRAAGREECHAGDGQLLALKRVSVGQLSDAGAEKAKEEARLLQRLGSEHDCILRCFDFRLLPAGNAPGSAQPVLELLLEFAPLGDLSCRIRAHRDAQGEVRHGPGLPELEVIAYGCDVAAGLAHLHALRPKVFHRDVKPANVVLFYGGAEAGGRAAIPRAKLADFGIAKVLECEGTCAGAATVIGTPHYFSPEICRGERYDERADAWALGCVLYEMVCLRRPFHQFEGNIAVLALRISEGRYDNDLLKRQAIAYNGLLIFTLFGLLTKDQESRSRAGDAAQSLRDLQSDTTPSAAEDADSWWQVPAAGAESADGGMSGNAQAQEGMSANLNGESEGWSGAVAAEVSDVVTQRPSDLHAQQVLAEAAGSAPATVMTDLVSEITPNAASSEFGGTMHPEQLEHGSTEASPTTGHTWAGTFRINVASAAPDEGLIASNGVPAHYDKDEVRPFTPFSAAPQHDVPLSVRSFISELDGEHDAVRSQSTLGSAPAEPAKKIFSTAPIAPPPVGLSREPSAPQTEMLGEMFFASGSQGGSASRSAWAGPPETHHPNLTVPAEESVGLPDAFAPASPAGTRLFVRPLWRPGTAEAVEAVEAPVVFRFEPIMRPFAALPSAEGGVADASGAEVANYQLEDVETRLGSGWLEVRFTPQGNEIVLPSAQADDHGIFGLTSLE